MLKIDSELIISGLGLYPWSKINLRNPDSGRQVLDLVIWLNTTIKIRGELIEYLAGSGTINIHIRFVP